MAASTLEMPKTRAPQSRLWTLSRLWSRVVQCRVAGFPVRCWMRADRAKALMRGLATGLVATLNPSIGKALSALRAVRIGSASGPAGGTTSIVVVNGGVIAYSFSAARTCWLWFSGLTLGKTLEILPCSSMIKVERMMPMEVLPYIFFSPQAP